MFTAPLPAPISFAVVSSCCNRMEDLPTIAPYALGAIAVCTALYVIIQGCMHDSRKQRAQQQAMQDGPVTPGAPLPVGTKLASRSTKNGVTASNAAEAALLNELEELERELASVEASLGIELDTREAVNDDVAGSEDIDGEEVESEGELPASEAPVGAHGRPHGALSRSQAKEMLDRLEHSTYAAPWRDFRKREAMATSGDAVPPS